MIRRGTRALALLAAAAVLTTAGAAVAQTAPRSAGGATQHLDERQASGQIQLAGGGLANLSGRLSVSANLPSRAVIRLVDRAGDASVYVSGRRVRLGRAGRATVRGATGIVFASGSNLVFQVNGGRFELSAAGIGRVALRGYGRVRLNLGPERAWPRGAIQLAPGSSERSHRRPDDSSRHRRD